MPDDAPAQTDPTQRTPVVTAPPPPAPPATGRTTSATPPPGGRRRGLVIALVVAAVVILSGIGAGAWLVGSRKAAENAAGSTAPAAGAFASAMRKAKVSAPTAPTQPVDLARVKPSAGSHSFEAVFTPVELTALLAAFPHAVDVGGTKVDVSRVVISSAGNGALTLSAIAHTPGNTIQATASGPVAYQNGHVVSTNGPLAIQAEGLPLPASQAQQATNLLLAYVNGYLAAAPGLIVKTAEVTSAGVHVTGVAPDAIGW